MAHARSGDDSEGEEGASEDSLPSTGGVEEILSAMELGAVIEINEEDLDALFKSIAVFSLNTDLRITIQHRIKNGRAFLGGIIEEIEQ